MSSINNDKDTRKMIQRMDSIISGVTQSNSVASSSTSANRFDQLTNASALRTTNAPSIHSSYLTSEDNTNVVSSVSVAAKKLAILLQQNENMAHQPDPFTANIINTWLETHLPRQDTDERLRRLKNDKESLAMQVQLLSEQVLQREMLTRSSLETQKLELMSAMSELKLHQAALERENLELRSTHLNNNTISTDHRLPPVPASRFRANSSSGSMTPPSTGRRQIDIQYNSLPRATSATTSTPIQYSANDSVNDSSSNGNSIDSNANLKQRNIVAFAETEKIIDDIADIPAQTSYSPSMSNKSKSLSGLRNIFGKLRRSNSGNLEDLPLDGNEFRRGGVRATAGPRLGWNNASATNGFRLSVERSKPFAEWNVDAVCSWFDELGLGF